MRITEGQGTIYSHRHKHTVRIRDIHALTIRLTGLTYTVRKEGYTHTVRTHPHSKDTPTQ